MENSQDFHANGRQRSIARVARAQVTRDVASVLCGLAVMAAGATCSHSQSSTATDPPRAAEATSSSFVDKVQAFQASVLLLDNIPPAEESQMLRQSVERLADALALTPTKVQVMQPALDMAAGAMRNDWVRWGNLLETAEGAGPDQRTASAQRALGTAEGALRTLSEQDTRYAGASITAGLNELQAAVQRIDVSQPLPTARSAVIEALKVASRLMESVKQAATTTSPV
jgi:hypothetical protein